MMVSQEIAMKNTAPEQKRIMRFLPLVFGIVLIRFPAGLFVYWVTPNVISIVQNLLIYRNVPKPGAEEIEPGPAETELAETAGSADNGHRTETNAALDRPAPNGTRQSKAKKRR
jgi:YidC/Oxa1 family membrane protein insertase